MSVVFTENGTRKEEDVEDNAESVEDTETGDEAKEGDLEVEVCVVEDPEGDKVS